MNLQPFYDLRERLLVSAAAGTQFVQEDFRLKEAAKKIEAFAKASPVFAKLSQLLGELINGAKEKKAEVLLDVLGLLDAFLTTQGICQAEGEILPAVEEGTAALPARQKEMIYQEIPYSRLQPIKWALTETGSGRQNTLEESYAKEPELFMDFRICPLMIHALSDAYAEIADMVCGWLIKLGEPVIPLLKEGFLPKGRKEMVRRIRVISEIAGAGENKFYCTQLLESEKEVREALIRALRFTQENQPLLFDLLKTEKGKMKAVVQWVLSFMEGEEVEQYWKKRATANPVETAQLLHYSSASYAPSVVANLVRMDGEALLREEEERARIKKEEKITKGDKQETEKLRLRDDKFRICIRACTGKLGKEIVDLLKWSANEPRLKRFHLEFAIMMAETIKEMPLERAETKAYARLAGELFEQVGRDYVRPAFTASLFMAPPEETYDMFSKHIESMGFGIFRVLQQMQYREDIGYFVYLEKKLDEKGDAYTAEKIRVLEQGLDLRWYSLIMENKKNCPKDYYPAAGTSLVGSDAVLYRLFRGDVPDLCQKYGEYFYRQAIVAEPTVAHVEILKKCGWTKFNGILLQVVKKNNWSYYLRGLMNILPMTKEQLMEELELILTYEKGLSQKGATGRATISTMNTVKNWLETLRNGGTLYDLL